MDRCPDCNSVLTKTEKLCGACGSTVVRKSVEGSKAKFAMLANVAFYISAAITAAAIFVPGMPPVSKCLPVCIVLLMIRSSADQMIDNSSK